MNCLLFQRILAIVGLGFILGAADSWIRPTTVSLVPPSAPATSNPAANAVSPTTPSIEASANPQSESSQSGATDVPAAPTPLGLMIDVKAAKELFDHGVVFLDARIDEEFKAGHVPQAFQLTSSMFNTPAADDAMKALDPAQPIVIYCGGGDCDASKNLAILLQGAGYKRIHIFEAGFPAWEKAGHPIEKVSK